MAVPFVLLASTAMAAQHKAAPRAPEAPALAVHPIALERASRRGNEELLALFEKAVVTEVDVVPFATVQEFVEKQSGGTCANRTPCLQALAKATGARYVLFASIAPNGPKLQLEARLVRADGKVMRDVLKLSADKPADWTREAAVEEGYRLLLAKLKLTTVPGIKKARPPESEAPAAEPAEPPPAKAPVAEPVVAAKTPPVASAPRETSRPVAAAPIEVARPAAGGSNALRTTGFVVAGAGVALGAGALVMGLLANNDAKALTPNANGWVPTSQVPTALAMRSKASAAAGLGAGAAVAVAAGVTLVVLGGRDSGVALVPTSGGAMLVMSGALP